MWHAGLCMAFTGSSIEDQPGPSQYNARMRHRLIRPWGVLDQSWSCPNLNLLYRLLMRISISVARQASWSLDFTPGSQNRAGLSRCFRRGVQLGFPPFPTVSDLALFSCQVESIALIRICDFTFGDDPPSLPFHMSLPQNLHLDTVQNDIVGSVGKQTYSRRWWWFRPWAWSLQSWISTVVFCC